MNAPETALPVERARRYFWTTGEDRVLRELYGTPGGPALVAQRTGRALQAVYARARVLGLRGVRYIPQGARSRRYAAEPWMDEEIRRVYQERPQRGAILALAARLMRPRHWVLNRARVLGLAVARVKEPEWTREEEDLLRRLAHHRPEVIAQKFRRSGYRRTATAIAVKRKRLALDIRDPDRWTATQLAHLMGVDAKTVCRWIAREGLPAARRGTARTPAQGGDMWQIERTGLRRWIASHAQLVDLRKVDRFWFLDLAFGRAVTP